MQRNRVDRECGLVLKSDNPVLSEGSHLAEQNVLSARYDDFLSRGKHEENTGGVQEAGLPDVEQVDDTIAGGAKKRRAIQPALAFREQTPDENGCVLELDPCLISAGFKKPNFRGSDEPAPGIVAQKDEIIETKCAIVLFHGQVGW